MHPSTDGVKESSSSRWVPHLLGALLCPPDRDSSPQAIPELDLLLLLTKGGLLARSLSTGDLVMPVAPNYSKLAGGVQVVGHRDHPVHSGAPGGVRVAVVDLWVFARRRALAVALLVERSSTGACTACSEVLQSESRLREDVHRCACLSLPGMAALGADKRGAREGEEGEGGTWTA